MLITFLQEVMCVTSDFIVCSLAHKLHQRHPEKYIRKQKSHTGKSKNIHTNIFSLKSAENKNIQPPLAEKQHS